MRRICCTEFGDDTRINQIIVNNNGEKNSYYREQDTFIENGEDLGVIEIEARNIPENIRPDIMESMKRNFNSRLTRHALKIKGQIIEKDNQQQDITRG